jgi:hypothetical protein
MISISDIPNMTMSIKQLATAAYKIFAKQFFGKNAATVSAIVYPSNCCQDSLL